MIEIFRRIHRKLIGDPLAITMEARIFHEVCIVAIVSLVFFVGVNLFVRIPFVSAVMFSSAVLMTFLFVNSRYWGNSKTSVILFTILGNLMLIFNFFLNSGINGPTLLIFMLAFFFTTSVMPNKEYRFWVALNGFVVASLLTVEYYFPELVKNSYASRSGYFVDTGFSYLVIMTIISIILTYIRKSYEAEKNNSLKKSIALEQANESKTKLLSILSHDMRSPLNSIQSFLEVLIDYDLNEDEKKSITASLLNETKNTQTMLVNLLSWTKSQMETGLKVNRFELNGFETLKVTIDIQQTAALEKLISIRNEIDPGLFLFADADMLKLVFRNVVNNAIKFTRSGGEIVLSSRADVDYHVLIIADNGIGISAAKQPYVFSLDITSTYGTKHEKGVGLGLLLCKEYMEVQGGKISFESKEGVGTVFYLSFPVADLQVNPADPEDEAYSDQKLQG
ncbi:sensor histidine kinase [Pedobacter metabolipauper]|uniref:histidine kinase n=1 Tax=Pedobacter metabolipauper TaxID=425513 RepID=A0A4R6SZ73_9SPHI|nr:HAMP domain-containing sensor histidine kinase [Pedobacter metabolipauper]TDQ10042.1 phospho-acceptor domain-containing protein [Pedobacter metabolipauper]